MHVDSEEHQGHLVAHVSGSIELAGGEKLARVPYLQEATRDVVLDLGGVDFLDSSGVRVLLGIIRRFRGSPYRLVLARPTPLVLKTLHLVNFDQLVLITDSIEAAVGSLSD